MPPSFFYNAISRPPKMMEHTSVSKAPASVKFTKSTRACWRLSSVAPANWSLMCCAVMPSGPPDEPSGKVRRAFIMSSLDTCSGSKRGLPLGSHGLRRSIAGPGCFACRAFSVSWLTGAIVSLEQTILNAALKLPASNLLDTAEANLLLSFTLLEALPCVVHRSTVGIASLSQTTVRLLTMLLRFLFDPPHFSLARMVGPKFSSSCHATLSFGLATIFLRICDSSAVLDAMLPLECG